MIRRGTDNVTRPDGMVEFPDFLQVQEIVRSMSGLYPESAVGAVRTKDDIDLGGMSMIELMARGEYQEAASYFAYRCDFVPI